MNPSHQGESKTTFTGPRGTCHTHITTPISPSPTPLSLSISPQSLHLFVECHNLSCDAQGGRKRSRCLQNGEINLKRVRTLSLKYGKGGEEFRTAERVKREEERWEKRESISLLC